MRGSCPTQIRLPTDALRFDFAHKQAMTQDEIREVEDIINAKIAEDERQ